MNILRLADHVVLVQLLSCVRPFATPWTTACQAPLSFTISLSLLRFMSTELVMLCKNLILCCPFFSCPQSFSAARPFPVSQFFASGGQSFRASASASVLPMNILGLFSLELTSWISLQTKGLSRVFSNTIVQKHQFFST